MVDDDRDSKEPAPDGTSEQAKTSSDSEAPSDEKRSDEREDKAKGDDEPEAKGDDEPEAKGDDEPEAKGRPESKGDAPPASAPAEGKAWALPVQRFADAWTKFEVRLCATVLIAEILALCAWVVLKGLAMPGGSDSNAGVIVRACLGATIFGLAAYFIVRKKNVTMVRFATMGAIIVGLVLGRASDGIGTVYFSNFLNWLQDASSLALVGGLRGLGTRLTVWLAMLGGSLAAASGKHIHIDVVRRFLPEKLRMPATLVAWAAAACMLFIAAWGFTDHIVIGSYHVDRDAPASEKLAKIGEEAKIGFFLLRKQASLDMSTLPVILSGKPYDSWLTNAAWNERIRDAGWEDYFTAEQVAALQMPPEIAQGTRLPMVVVPDESANGLLVHLLNLVFPFGFIFIGLRLLLRGVLAAGGLVKDEPEGAGEAEADKAAIADAKEGADQ